MYLDMAPNNNDSDYEEEVVNKEIVEIGQLRGEHAALCTLINQNASAAGSQDPSDSPGPATQSVQGGVRGKNPNAKLSDFNGLTKSYQLWLYSLEHYLSYECFNVIKWILAALSYICEGTAATWAQNFYDQNKDANSNIVYAGTQADFKELINNVFNDPNLEQEAQKKLAKFRQDDKTTATFCQGLLF